VKAVKWLKSASGVGVKISISRREMRENSVEEEERREESSWPIFKAGLVWR